MTNSTTPSAICRRGTATASSSRNILCIIACIAGLVAAGAVAVAGAIVWNSPATFFAAIAAGFFCVDPLRAAAAAQS